jgi:hypothetical protein
VLIPSVGQAQFKPGSGELKGYMIGEYYYIANHHTGNFKENDDGIQGRHGFWFRRIYLTYNNKLSDTVKMRLRMEMASTSNLLSSSTLVPFVKDAYLSWKFAGSSSLVAGIQSPPSFAQVEDIWGYRSLEKTPLDLYKWTSSRDFGISVKGGETALYQLMLANGSSNKSEADNGKKVYGALGYTSGGFFVEAMAQYEKARLSGNDDIIAQGFAAFQGDWGRIGAQYSYRDLKDAAKDKKYKYSLVSVFAVFKASEKIDLIARWDGTMGDGWQESFSGSKVSYIPFANNHKFNFYIGAISWQAHKNVWLIPNVKFTAYTENSMLKNINIYEKPKNDMYLNLTLWFKF